MLPWKDSDMSREAWFVAQASLRMPFSKRRVVEFGSASGEITALLLADGFDVVAIEGREESHNLAAKNAPGAHRILADIETLIPNNVRPYDLIFHVGVLYHLLGPMEHLMQLHRWGSRLLLDTHYCDGECPQLHRETVSKPRAGLRTSSWWLPKMFIENKLRSRWKTVEMINDRVERNGPRATWWAEN